MSTVLWISVAQCPLFSFFVLLIMLYLLGSTYPSAKNCKLLQLHLRLKWWNIHLVSVTAQSWQVNKCGKIIKGLFKPKQIRICRCTCLCRCQPFIWRQPHGWLFYNSEGTFISRQTSKILWNCDWLHKTQMWNAFKKWLLLLHSIRLLIKRKMKYFSMVNCIQFFKLF